MRQRIVDATVALHQEVGMLRTTIKEVAQRAGVERATVYRHFPDEVSLIRACTGHYFAQNPPPDPRPWLDKPDPVARLQAGLAEIYAYHQQTERMMTRTLPEIPQLPAAQEVALPLLQHWHRVRDVLVIGWDANDAQHEVLTALVGHAIGFWTWRSLVMEQGLDDAQAVEAMVTLVRGYRSIGQERLAGRPSPGDR